MIARPRERSRPGPFRLVYICDWLPPDFGAVGQYALAAARARAADGESVTLFGLTSRIATIEHEDHPPGKLTVVRVHTASYDKANLLRRAWWTLRTNLRLLARAWQSMAEADEIVFTGSPPFLVHFLVPANVFLRKRLTYRITDFHPECLIAELGRAPWPLRILRAVTIALRRRVDHFEVLGEDQRRRLLEIGIAEEVIELRRDTSPVEITADTQPLPRPSKLLGHAEPTAADRESPVVLLYSGNFGVAHDHQTLIAGYRRHHREGSGRVVLWLNATGAKADLVERQLRAEGLPVCRTQPVPLANLARLLVTPDAHLITLRDPFVGYVLPSKVYGCIASGRPILFIGSKLSDVHLLACERVRPASYLQVNPGDVDAVAAALKRLGDRADISLEKPADSTASTD